MLSGRTLVVCTIGAGTPDFFQLPASRMDEQNEFISGGERTFYELAVAAAVLGVDVELRGHLNPQILGVLTAAAGASPKVDLPTRLPRMSDVVVVPDAPSTEMQLCRELSGAQWVMYLLSPPGLWGWAYQPGWTQPDMSTVAFDGIGTPQMFRDIHRFGFSIWTHTRGIARAAEGAGVPARWVGTGTPVPFPRAPSVGCRPFDLAIVTANRWAQAAEKVALERPEARTLRIGRVTSAYSLSPHLAEARILIWPSRIEGLSRIAREARGVGTVPVALDTNPFLTREDHGPGVVLVKDLDELAREAGGLLADSARLQSLSADAIQGVAEQAKWDRYVARVAEALVELDGAREEVGLGCDPARHILGRSALRIMEETSNRQLTEEIGAPRDQIQRFDRLPLTRIIRRLWIGCRSVALRRAGRRIRIRGTVWTRRRQ